MVRVDIIPALRRSASQGRGRAARLLTWPRRLVAVLAGLREYRRQEWALGARPLPLEAYLKLTDDVVATPYDPHYAVQGAWVLRGLLEQHPPEHVDVGSHVDYLGFFAAVAPTTFIDIRPTHLVVPGLTERRGSVLELPYDDRSVPSISCLHVVEHVGLGRYGDPIDARGLQRACTELARTLAVGGRLYLATPVGRPRLCFNAHRVSSPLEIAAAMPQLTLESFDIVTDEGTYLFDEEPARWIEQDYALGMFRFGRSV